MESEANMDDVSTRCVFFVFFEFRAPYASKKARRSSTSTVQPGGIGRILPAVTNYSSPGTARLPYSGRPT